MARVEDLVAQVPDPELRRELAAAVADLKKHQHFGLVFEEHIPETTALFGLPIRAGAIVQLRDDQAPTTYRVIAVESDQAVIEPVAGGESCSVQFSDLLTIKRFGEPIFPALTSVGAVRRGEPSHPHHAVINGENYHALQILLYMYEGQVDCIYIDPPYNTGARDWKYNNRYVDSNDTWRHSKWLSMMEKRLKLAKKLLKTDGVLIVTIGEHELFHLGMLLEKTFPGYLRYVVTIVISARGNYRVNFARVEEYALFFCPPTGRDVITGSPIDLLPEQNDIDVDPNEDEEDEEEDADEQLTLIEPDGAVIELRHARRRGPDSNRSNRPTMFYPIFVDERELRVVRAGQPIPEDEEPQITAVNGHRPVWPIDGKGKHRRWRWGQPRMQEAIERGDVKLGKYNRRSDSWTINLVIRRENALKKIKTVWRHTSHDAGTHGASLLETLLGQRALFPFPKSVYAVRDTLAAVVRNRPDALIVDFFAGSGTTFHATCLLNAADNGRRRSILVTNNEVSEPEAAQLHNGGHYRGDPTFESRGIFERVTRPRCEAVVTGHRPDGAEIPGAHIGGRAFADGFAENLEFFRLDYLDPDEVALGQRFTAILPSLWLAAGGVGEREPAGVGADFSIPTGSNYAVLIRESRFRQFLAALSERTDVSHVWLVTDSDQAFAEMRSMLPRQLRVSMLYRDYLRSFRATAG